MQMMTRDELLDATKKALLKNPDNKYLQAVAWHLEYCNNILNATENIQDRLKQERKEKEHYRKLYFKVVTK